MYQRTLIAAVIFCFFLIPFLSAEIIGQGSTFLVGDKVIITGMNGIHYFTRDGEYIRTIKQGGSRLPLHAEIDLATGSTKYGIIRWITHQIDRASYLYGRLAP